MSRSEVPEPWAQRMVDRGFTRRDGEANISALARAMGVSVETARRAVKGIGTAKPETVTALVKHLGSDVQAWIGQTVAAGPYQPPSESALLTGPQRDALTDLIRAIARDRLRGEVGDHADAAGGSTATSQAAGSAATNDDAGQVPTGRDSAGDETATVPPPEEAASQRSTHDRAGHDLDG